MKFATKTVHAGVKPDPTTGAIMTPIYQTSTYVQEGVGNHKGYEYSRTQNPTRAALQESITALENGKYGLCFSSGMAAIDTVAKLLNPGDEVVCTNDLYGGSYRIFTTVFARYGIKFHFIPMQNIKVIKAAINENTKLIWVETPSNPMLNVTDIEAIAAIKGNALLAIDNTFATPCLQTPLDLGADIVMHSVTKYLSGHSDVLMGALALNDEKLAEKLATIQNSCGAVPGPQDCFWLLAMITLASNPLSNHRHLQFLYSIG